jgi:outer membrane biosynthesis protein TonB
MMSSLPSPLRSATVAKAAPVAASSTTCGANVGAGPLEPPPVPPVAPEAPATPPVPPVSVPPPEPPEPPVAPCPPEPASPADPEVPVPPLPETPPVPARPPDPEAPPVPDAPPGASSSLPPQATKASRSPAKQKRHLRLSTLMCDQCHTHGHRQPPKCTSPRQSGPKLHRDAAILHPARQPSILGDFVGSKRKPQPRSAMDAHQHLY